MVRPILIEFKFNFRASPSRALPRAFSIGSVQWELMMGRLNCVSYAAGSTRASLLYRFLVCSTCHTCHMPHATATTHTHTHTLSRRVQLFLAINQECCWLRRRRPSLLCPPQSAGRELTVGGRGLRAVLPPLKKGTHTHSFLLPASHSTFLNIFNCCASFHAWVGQGQERGRRQWWLEGYTWGVEVELAAWQG